MLLSKKSLFTAIAVTTLISSCSSRVKPEFQDFFRSEIRDDNSKMFTFTVITSRRAQYRGSQQEAPANSEQKGGKDGGKSGRGGNQGSDDQAGGEKSRTLNNSDSKRSSYNDKITQLMIAQLAVRLDKNKYCRKGYFELETSIGDTISSIRGECNEAATAYDRMHFISNN